MIVSILIVLIRFNEQGFSQSISPGEYHTESNDPIMLFSSNNRVDLFFLHCFVLKTSLYTGTLRVVGDTLMLTIVPGEEPGDCTVVSEEPLDNSTKSEGWISIINMLVQKSWQSKSSDKRHHFDYMKKYEEPIDVDKGLVILQDSENTKMAYQFSGHETTLFLQKGYDSLQLTSQYRDYFIKLDLKSYFNKRVNMRCNLYSIIYNFTSEAWEECYIILRSDKKSIELKSLSKKDKPRILKYRKVAVFP
jgi:hypothetical protein